MATQDQIRFKSGGLVTFFPSPPDISLIRAEIKYLKESKDIRALEYSINLLFGDLKSSEEALRLALPDLRSTLPSTGSLQVRYARLYENLVDESVSGKLSGIIRNANIKNPESFESLMGYILSSPYSGASSAIVGQGMDYIKSRTPSYSTFSVIAGASLINDPNLAFSQIRTSTLSATKEAIAALEEINTSYRSLNTTMSDAINSIKAGKPNSQATSDILNYLSKIEDQTKVLLLHLQISF
jgi:hypothetical protein